MAETTAQPAGEPHLVIRAWRFAGSLRVGIVLLAVLTAASVVGIVLPQPESFRADSYVSRRIDPKSPKALPKPELATLKAIAGVKDDPHKPPTRGDYLRIYYLDTFGKALGWLLLKASVHRLFASWWFRALCVLFILDLMACSLRRIGGQWRSAFGTKPGTEPGWYERRSSHATLTSAADSDASVEAVARALRGQGFRVESQRGDEGVTLAAWRGLLGPLAGLGRLGSQVVHLGVVLVVLGGFVSGLLSRSRDQVATPGDVVVVPPAHSLLLMTKEQLASVEWRHDPKKTSPPSAFRLRLDRFDARFNLAGKPEYYGAHVTVLGASPPIQRVIEVNRPLIYRGYYVYQQSYQADYSRMSAVTFRVARVERTGETHERFHGPASPVKVLRQFEIVASPDRAVVIPGTGLTLRVLEYFPHWVAALDRGPDGKMVLGTPHNASNEPRNPALRVRIESAGAEPLERWLFLLFPENDRGRTADYGDFRIVPTDLAPAYNTVLEFKTHPILWPVWVGCGVMMAGIVLCFYCNHERVWALVRPREGGSELWLAGDAFKWREQFRQRFDAVVTKLSEAS